MAKCDVNQLTMGELIAALRRKPADSPLRMDFDYFRPVCVGSYRGFYEDVAISYDRETEVTVGTFLEHLESKLSSEMTGYKGGTYDIDEGTAVWASNYGDAASVAVVDVEPVGCYIVLRTKFVEA
jgi:hypothetical protein